MEEFSLPSARGIARADTTTSASTVLHQVIGTHDQIGTREVDALIKNKIASHPRYPALLAAFIDCQKIGASPEIIDRLSTVLRELKLHQRTDHHTRNSFDPELDQFMETYSNMLVKYKGELMRPIQEAAQFFKTVESLLLSHGLQSSSSDEKNEGIGSSDQEIHHASTGEGTLEFDPSMEDNKELKNQLLKKYSGYMSSLWKELSKKKKKGKLPKDARWKLLSWWERHHKWPYPSETDKAALAETTGLDPKQINNWFINQRKRHWKPSEDMRFVVMDGLYPHNVGSSAFYIDGRFMGDALYRRLRA